MHKSETRVLTTHVGSLPRSPSLSELLIAQDHGRPVDPEGLRQAIQAGIAHVVEKQLECGIDIGNDGEQPRAGYSTYPSQRMKGFGGESKRNDVPGLDKYPLYAERFRSAYRASAEESSRVINAPQAISEVVYDETLTGVREECDAFEEVLDPHSETFTETFMTAASPGCVLTIMHNAYYPSDRDYLFALARELKQEYDYIVSRGYILQIDSPDLAMERQLYFRDKSDTEFLKSIEVQIEALNIALADVPPERVRMHVCWGTWDGPHDGDTPLEPILPRLYEANVGALCMPFANPRHQHEYKRFKRNPLPDSMILIPGMIDNTTNYIEHPEVVADRICQAVETVGERERVIAGADCGFSVFTDFALVTEDICWAKFRSLREGADIATKRLWG